MVFRALLRRRFIVDVFQYVSDVGNEVNASAYSFFNVRLFLENDVDVVFDVELHDPLVDRSRFSIEELFRFVVYPRSSVACRLQSVGMVALHVFESPVLDESEEGGNGNQSVPVPVPIPVYRGFQNESVLVAECFEIHNKRPDFSGP